MARIDSVLKRAQARRRLPSPAERRRLREDVGLSQEEVASLIGVTRPTITRYERGERTPSGDVALRYLRLLDRLRREAES